MIDQLFEEKCSSCGAAVVWIKTEEGKKMPLDPKVLTVVAPNGKTTRGRQSHFSSCPEAKEHRGAESKRWGILVKIDTLKLGGAMSAIDTDNATIRAVFVGTRAQASAHSVVLLRNAGITVVIEEKTP